MDKLAGWARKEEYNEIQPEPVAPHYCRFTAVQAILLDGSILGNLEQKIPEAITTTRGKQQMRQTLKMMEEHMAMIDKEITANNARNFGMSSSARARLKKKTPTNGTWRRANKFDDRIAATYRCCDNREDKTFCDVQAEWRFTKSMSKPLDEKWGTLRCQIIKAGIDLALINADTHIRENWNGNCEGSLMELKIAELLNDDKIPQHFKRAFKQQTMIGWELLFMGMTARGWRQCWWDNIFLEIRHCVYIYGMGQSMLEAPQLHTDWRTQNKYKITRLWLMADACVLMEAPATDIDPTATRLVEAETIEESWKFGHPILAWRQQNIMKMRPEGDWCLKMR